MWNHGAHEIAVVDGRLAAVQDDAAAQKHRAHEHHSNVRLRVPVHVEHPGQHHQPHRPAHGQGHEQPALTPADVSPLPGTGEHRPIHDHHAGQDHRGEPQVHLQGAAGRLMTPAAITTLVTAVLCL
ncbi:hypothetical protein ACFFX0_32065 [Citricoccus parietis]|uniref:Uncharacterized protein n=1 Tax=Citricoccus parietis TaxID=592307 RepID=A0ABV5G9B0_9MICC